MFGLTVYYIKIKGICEIINQFKNVINLKIHMMRVNIKHLKLIMLIMLIILIMFINVF